MPIDFATLEARARVLGVMDPPTEGACALSMETADGSGAGPMIV
jgi:hypothetical protein